MSEAMSTTMALKILTQIRDRYVRKIARLSARLQDERDEDEVGEGPNRARVVLGLKGTLHQARTEADAVGLAIAALAKRSAQTQSTESTGGR